VANICRTALRKTDTVCRFGGDEFVVALPNTALDEAMLLAERLQLRLRNELLQFSVEGAMVTASVGVTTMRPEDGSYMDTLQRADRALYEAKSQGKDRIVFACRDRTSPPRRSPSWAPSAFDHVVLRRISGERLFVLRRLAGKEGHAALCIVFENDASREPDMLGQQIHGTCRVAGNRRLCDVVVFRIQMRTVDMDGQHAIAFGMAIQQLADAHKPRAVASFHQCAVKARM